MEIDRATALRQAILACRKGGIVSVLGVYGVTDKSPMGIVTNKGLTLKSNSTGSATSRNSSTT